MREKIVRVKDPHEVIYSREHMNIIEEKRKSAVAVMELFDPSCLLYGSLTRGDVHPESDIDLVFLTPVATYNIELPLLDNNYNFLLRELVQANPNSVPKAHIHLEGNITLTVPLFKPGRNEDEFYRFGGAMELEEVRSDVFVPGVTKKLLFIEPMENGHMEYSIIGSEVEVAKKLGLHIETVNERVRVLSRRDEIGRTGVYLKEQLGEDDSFESVWKYLSDRDPVLRRQMRSKKK